MHPVRHTYPRNLSEEECVCPCMCVLPVDSERLPDLLLFGHADDARRSPAGAPDAAAPPGAHASAAPSPLSSHQPTCLTCRTAHLLAVVQHAAAAHWQNSPAETEEHHNVTTKQSSRCSEYGPAGSDWNYDKSDPVDLRGRCTCSARVACASCRSRVYWHDWGVDWSTGSNHFDLTGESCCCSYSSWETPEHLRQQRGWI